MTQVEIESLIKFSNEFNHRAEALRLGPTELSRRTETDETEGISVGYINDILRVGRGDSEKRFRIYPDKVTRLARAVEWDESEALDFAGYKRADAGAESENKRTADAALMAAGVENLAMLSTDEKAQAVAALKAFREGHPEALDILGPNFKVKTTDEIDQDQTHIKKEDTKPK